MGGDPGSAEAAPGRPALSVVIPTHDTAELTLRCLASVASDPAAPEVVVVDDGSRDGTAEQVAARFPGVELVRNAEALGFTRAANRGMARARGEVVLLLNSDTEVEPGGLAALLRELAERPRLGVAGAVLLYPDGRPQWNGGPPPTLPWLLALASGAPALLRRLPLYRRVRPGHRSGAVAWATGAALAVRRRLWSELAGFDVRYRFYGQDLDLCLRARRAGWEVAVVPGLRVLHHHGATIRRRTAARELGYHPELLWTDLLRWWHKERGARGARRAAAVLVLGGRLRLAARRLAQPFVPAAERDGWRTSSAAFRQAVAAVGALARELQASGPAGETMT